MIRILLWISIIWMAPFICLMLKNETKFKKNLAIGVTFPAEGKTDADVIARLNKFKKHNRWVCIILLVLAIPGMVIQSFNTSFTLWCVWIIIAVALPYVPYAMCNTDLKRIKKEKGWVKTDVSVISVNTKDIVPVKWLSPYMFVIPLLLSLLPLLWDDAALWTVYIIDAACIVMFYFCYRYLYRNKAEKIDDNVALTIALTQVRRYNWGRIWIISSYSLAVLNLLLSLTKFSQFSLIFTVILTAIMVVGLTFVDLRTRKIQEKLTKDSGTKSYVDDDDKWIWGIFYYNPKDSHNFVNNRIGTNMTMNLAKPAGKALMGFTLALLLALPFTMPIINYIVDKPINVVPNTYMIEASSGKTEYVINYSDISDIQLLDELPEKMVKSVGTNTETLYKGRFYSPSTGGVDVILDPTVPPFILIETKNGSHYLLGERAPQNAKDTYQTIKYNWGNVN